MVRDWKNLWTFMEPGRQRNVRNAGGFYPEKYVRQDRHPIFYGENT